MTSLRTIAAALILSGCASLPAKDVYVSWRTPCSDGMQVRLVRFHDSPAPLLDCIRAARPDERPGFVLLTLLGFPIAACAVQHTGTDYAEVYAPISPSATQALTTMASLTGPQDIVEHELRHLWGYQHPALLNWMESCR